MLPDIDYMVRHLSAAWRVMVTGRDEALSQMDVSAEGFWRSFWSILVALPALAAGWLAAAPDYVLPEGASAGSMLIRLAATDLLVWIVPIVLLGAAAGRLGIRDRFARYIITSNWGSAIMAWLIVPPVLVGNMAGDGNDLATALQLAAFIFLLVLGWRLTWAVFARDSAQASLVFTFVIVLSVMTNVAAMQVMGLTLQP